jgi:dienelactone hydrolase
LLVAACGTLPPPVPEPQPFESLSIELADTARNKALPVRVTFPAKGLRLPVILFSHGAYSSKDLYGPIADAWAAAGYVVVQPTHRDSVSLGATRGTNDPRFWPDRLDDMEFLLRDLARIERAVPALAGRLDRESIVAAGHSFGGLVAQTIGGATYFDPVTQQTVSRLDRRIRAVIVFSGAGTLAPLLRPQDFASLKLPLLVTVGTNDLKQDPELTGFEWRKQPYDLAPTGVKYLVTFEGADHYLGGTVGRDDLPRDANGPVFLEAFNAASIAFLNAHVRRDAVAGETLQRWRAAGRIRPLASFAAD